MAIPIQKLACLVRQTPAVMTMWYNCTMKPQNSRVAHAASSTDWKSATLHDNSHLYPFALQDERSRFVDSFKRQFVDQESASLALRTAPTPAGPPLCDCLVAIAEDGILVGCTDLRLPAAATGEHPVGVPAGDSDGAYILNVVVHPDYRCTANDAANCLKTI